jgi:cytochrome c-type biogenesis protein CcmH
MIFAVLALLTALVVAMMVWPMLRKAKAPPTRAAFDMEVHRDQLEEIARDLARGTIDAREAQAARAEIGRRMLTLAAEPALEPAHTGGSRLLAVALAVALPAAAFALYIDRGAPGAPGVPFAEQRATGTNQDPQLVEFARALRARVANNPNDIEAWVRLAQVSAAFNLAEDALDAWRAADKLAGERPELAGSLGEAAVLAANGQVTPEAQRAFARVLAADPGDPRARYYMGQALAQAGDLNAAVRMWFDLAAASPPDAPWLATVREALAQAAREARIDLSRLRPSPDNRPAISSLAPPQSVFASAAPPQDAPQGVPPGGQALLALPEAERAQAIRGMVEGLAARLEAQPDDLEGWQRLARSWQALDEPEKALAAYARTAEIAPDQIPVLDAYADALLALHDPDTRLDDSARKAMANLLERSPNNALALWLVGLDEVAAGNQLAATALWQRLLALLPEGTPARAELVERIEKLKAGN